MEKAAAGCARGGAEHWRSEVRAPGYGVGSINFQCEICFADGTTRCALCLWANISSSLLNTVRANCSPRARAYICLLTRRIFRVGEIAFRCICTFPAQRVFTTAALMGICGFGV